MNTEYGPPWTEGPEYQRRLEESHARLLAAVKACMGQVWYTGLSCQEEMMMAMEEAEKLA